MRKAFSLLLTAAILAIAVHAAASQAIAQRRIALVIGNDNYEQVSSLLKARNDARAMTERLNAIGFEVVLAEDLGRRAMSRAVHELEKRVEPGDTVLFYYAGHGVSIEGNNFLLPVDIPQAGPGEEALVIDDSFHADTLAGRLQRNGAKTVVMILDACRNNPFEQPGQRSLNLKRGLSRMAPGEGIFVLFSAGVNQTALDSLSDLDPNPNSVFTRELLKELDKPRQSIVQLAKSVQINVRKLARQVAHVQTPAYYDQIIGNVTLNPGDGSQAGGGGSTTFREGQSATGVLPRSEVALADPGLRRPMANFMRSNSGWMVTMSLPEAATQFGYRLEGEEEFTDPGYTQALDPRTGRPMPKTFFELPPDQGETTFHVTWRDKRGEEAGVFPVEFDPMSALLSGQIGILNMTTTSWVALLENGLTYFTHLISYRCAIDEVRYGYNGGPLNRTWKLPECDPDDPHAVPTNARIFTPTPRGTKTMQVQLTFADGTTSKVKTFKPKR